MNQENQINRKNVNTAKSLAQTLIVNKCSNYDSIPEDLIKDCLNSGASLVNLSEEEKKVALRELLETTGHTMENGVLLSNKHQKWFADIKKGPMPYTERNRDYLINDPDDGLGPQIVMKLNEVTDEIMDCLGDPRNSGFKRYGMVMGEVQSGKTNTYAMICCKALDAGYQMIILLTGTTELLRSQTQKRLDRLLVGKDSSQNNIISGSNVSVGVGLRNSGIEPAVWTLTTSNNDFGRQFSAQLQSPVSDVNAPIFLALKKNSSILKNLYNWLKSNNKTHSKTYSKPLLLIDDEADNASVNTSADPGESTAINKGIKNILSLFDSSTYVGFTATPYANIFIDPDRENDLYPHDFIYSLESPSNYVGPVSMFSDNGENRFMVREIQVGDDGLPEIPYKHTKDLQVKELPQSLKEAVNCFLLSCAVRDLRDGTSDHMSMLINVSRFTDVQDRVKELVSRYLFDVNNSISAYSKLDPEDAARDPMIASLKRTWDDDYGIELENGPSWDLVLKMLQPSVGPVVVKSVNQRNKSKDLGYGDAKNGLRIIAVGGNSLSRGLTLNGLCVSYFYRRAESYDTLMQMGRWFGYRDGYRDLCRVWMAEDSMDWYSHIAEATDELRNEFVIMRNQGRTPDHFGFRVRNDINGLEVTARNKMRHAGDTVVTKCVSGEVIWTSRLYADPDKVELNDLHIDRFLTEIERENPSIVDPVTKNRVWRKVPSHFIKEFFQKYKWPAEDFLFDVSSITGIIGENDELSSWDVAVQQGSSERVFRYAGFSSNAVKRTSYRKKSGNDVNEGFYIRFNHSGLITPDHLMEGLCIDELADGRPIEDFKEHFRETVKSLKEAVEVRPDRNGKYNYPANTYLKTKSRRPLMLIYPVDITDTNSGSENYEEKKSVFSNLGDSQFPIGIALGFPAYRDEDDERSNKMMIKYKTTAIYDRMHGNEDLDDDGE